MSSCILGQTSDEIKGNTLNGNDLSLYAVNNYLFCCSMLNCDNRNSAIEMILELCLEPVCLPYNLLTYY